MATQLIVNINSIATGTADDVVVAATSFSGLDSGVFMFRAIGDNTGAMTMEANGLGPFPLTWGGGKPMVAGMVKTDQLCLVEYNDDESRFEMAISGGSLMSANNLSDVVSASTALQNLEAPRSAFAICNTHNPSDSSVMFFGNIPDSPTGTGGGVRRCSVPMGATILKSVRLTIITGTVGSAETGSIQIRVNGATDTNVFLNVAWDVNAQILTNDSVNLAIADTSYWEFKINYPTWVTTNPLAVKYGGILVFV